VSKCQVSPSTHNGEDGMLTLILEDIKMSHNKQLHSTMRVLYIVNIGIIEQVR